MTPTLQQLAESASKRHKMGIGVLCSANREQYTVKARDEVIWNARHYGYSLARIGRFLGNRDHTTILSRTKKWRTA